MSYHCDKPNGIYNVCLATIIQTCFGFAWMSNLLADNLDVSGMTKEFPHEMDHTLACPC